MGDIDRPGNDDLLFGQFRPIFSDCRSGLALTTGYTVDELHISILTHEIDTSLMEIVINEIITLKYIDVETPTPKVPPPGFVNIISVGTSGANHSKTAKRRSSTCSLWPEQQGPLLRCARQ